MLTLRKAKTAMCKLDIYNERFRYLSCAFQISVAIVSDIYFFRIARNRNKQKIFIVSLISINNIKFGLMVKCTPEWGHNALFFIPLQVFIML